MNDSMAMRVSDLLCAAFEGGSNHWYCELRVEQYPEGKSKADYDCWWIQVPLEEGGVLKFDLKDDFRNEEFRLNLEIITKGLRTMQDKYSWHWADFINENEDAETGDVFLQCCVFGDIVYA